MAALLGLSAHALGEGADSLSPAAPGGPDQRAQWLNSRVPPKPAVAPKPAAPARPSFRTTLPVAAPRSDAPAPESRPPKPDATEPATSRPGETRFPKPAAVAQATPARTRTSEGGTAKPSPTPAIAQATPGKSAKTEANLAKASPTAKPAKSEPSLAKASPTPTAKATPAVAVAQSTPGKSTKSEPGADKPTPAVAATSPSPAKSSKPEGTLARATPAAPAKPTPAVAAASPSPAKSSKATGTLAKATPAAPVKPAVAVAAASPVPVKSRTPEGVPTRIDPATLARMAGTTTKTSLTPAFVDIPTPKPAALTTPPNAKTLAAAARGAADSRYPWKSNIVTTIFWVGEPSGGHNLVPNFASSWDAHWSSSYGGFDNPDPAARRNYLPARFVPRQNPFYCALPYNDVTHGTTKPEVRQVIPWYKETFEREGQSICHDRWVAIRNRAGKVAYAQWSDCGPFRTDHWQYVFGNDRPKPNLNKGAGLDVSPAVRDYLGLGSTDVTDWKFVDLKDLPDGPWALHGSNNTYALKNAKKDGKAARTAANVATLRAREL